MQWLEQETTNVMLIDTICAIIDTLDTPIIPFDIGACAFEGICRNDFHWFTTQKRMRSDHPELGNKHEYINLPLPLKILQQQGYICWAFAINCNDNEYVVFTG